MQTSTVIVLACLLAAVMAAQYEHFPEPARFDADAALDTPAHDASPRTKRGLLLLKKKLLLGALGLKAVKVGAVGAAGVAGALALKSKSGHSHKHPDHTIEVHSKQHNHHNHHNHVGIPQSYVGVHDWSG